MTLHEIIKGLEGLHDSLNDAGKNSLSGFLSALKGIKVEEVKEVAVVPVVAPPTVVDEPKEVASPGPVLAPAKKFKPLNVVAKKNKVKTKGR